MKRQSGFTLVELLVTLAVATLLISIAVPNFKTTIQNGRLTTQANDVLASLVFARTQAVTANKNVTVCQSSDQASCSSSGTWANGWFICQEQDNKTTSTGCGTGFTPLRGHEALVGGNTLTNASGLKSITFAPNGALIAGSAGLYFDVCDSRGASYGRAIYIYPSGQARVSPTVGKQLDGTTSITC